MLRVNIKRLAMESPFNHFRYFGFIIIISLGLAQDDSTAIVTPGILKSQEALSLKTFDGETRHAIQAIFHEVYEIDGMYYELIEGGELTTFLLFDPRIDQV